MTYTDDSSLARPAIPQTEAPESTGKRNRDSRTRVIPTLRANTPTSQPPRLLPTTQTLSYPKYHTTHQCQPTTVTIHLPASGTARPAQHATNPEDPSRQHVPKEAWGYAV